MRKSILSLIALFATFTCFADSETIDFTTQSSISNLTILPNKENISTISTQNGTTLEFSPTEGVQGNFTILNQADLNYLEMKNLYGTEYTNYTFSISAPTGKNLKSVTINFKAVLINNFIQSSPLSPTFEYNSSTRVLDWNNINTHSISFNVTYTTHIYSIVITYEDDIPTSIGDSTQSQRPYSIIAGNGKIKVNGEWNSIRMFNSNGQLISANKDNVHCPAGTYLVQVNGDKAELVIVK